MTYIERSLGAAHVWGLGSEAASDLPLLLSLLDLAASDDADFPVIINELAVALESHLVVGKGHLGGAVAVVVLDRAGGLLDLLDSVLATVGASDDLGFNLFLKVEILETRLEMQN